MPDFAESQQTLDEAINRAKAAGADLEVGIQKVATNVVSAIGQALHGAISDLLKDENAIVAALDGWTLGPIEIAIKPIRLNKPRG